MTQGSVWIEGGEFCYIDSSGRKQCISAEELENSVSSNKSSIEKLISQKDSEFIPQILFVYSQDDGNGNPEIFAEGNVYNTSKSGLQSLSLTVDGDTERSSSYFVQSNSSQKVIFEDLPSTIGSKNICFVTDDGRDCIESVSVEPKVEVTITGTNSPVDAGNTVNVDVDLENVGTTSTTQPVELVIGGDTKDSQNVSLSSGGTSSITLSWSTTDPDDIGEYTALVQSDTNDDSSTVIVGGTGENFAVNITDTNSPVVSGENMLVDAKVENTGNGDASQDIKLDIDSTLEDTESSVFIKEGNTENVTLIWNVPDAQSDGDYTAKVYSSDDSDTQTVTVSSTANESFFDVTIDNFSVNSELDIDINIDYVSSLNNVLNDYEDPKDGEQISFDVSDDELVFKYTVTNTSPTDFSVVDNPDNLVVDNTTVDQEFTFETGGDEFLGLDESYSDYLYWDLSAGDYDVTIEKGPYSSETVTVAIGGTIVDDFEHGDLDANGWGGSISSSEWTTTTNAPFDGTTSAQGDSDGTTEVIHSGPGDGLNYYPQDGDVVVFPVRLDDTNHSILTEFLTNDTATASQDNNSKYQLRISTESDELVLSDQDTGASVSTDTISSAGVPTGERLDCEIDFSGSTVNASVKAPNGSFDKSLSIPFSKEYGRGVAVLAGASGSSDNVYIGKIEAQ